MLTEHIAIAMINRFFGHAFPAYPGIVFPPTFFVFRFSLSPFNLALSKLRVRRRSEPTFYGSSPGSPSSRTSDSANVDCLLELYSSVPVAISSVSFRRFRSCFKLVADSSPKSISCRSTYRRLIEQIKLGFATFRWPTRDAVVMRFWFSVLYV